MPKPPTLPQLVRELIDILPWRTKRLASISNAIRACEAKLDIVEAAHRETGRKARRHPISSDLIAQIQASTLTDGETARRLGLSRPTVAKYRKLGQP